MKKSRFTYSQIMAALKRVEAGLAVGIGAQGADARGVIAVLVMGMGLLGLGAIWIQPANEKQN